MSNKLVCIGYSFNDDHINEAIVDSAKQADNNLSIFAFVGPENYEQGDQSGHQTRLGRIAARCPGRINIYVGNVFHIGDAADRDQSDELLQRELWRFEGLVAFLTGDSA